MDKCFKDFANVTNNRNMTVISTVRTNESPYFYKAVFHSAGSTFSCKDKLNKQVR